MKIRKIPPAAPCHPFPLLIRSILAYSLVLEPEREIVYRDLHRYNYFALNRRVRQLANVLNGLGLDGGETVAIMDYDSHRYLECYFAVPMTGNVLHMINWRLSPAQILYTINHAEDTVLLVNADFLPLVEKFAGEMPSVKKIIVLKDSPAPAGNTSPSAASASSPAAGTPSFATSASSAGAPSASSLPLHGEYEALLAAAPDQYEFPAFEEDAVATTFYTTGTTGDPKGVYFTHRQLVLHTMSLAGSFGFAGGTGCRLSSDDVYMPLTPMFHVHAWGFPYLATLYSMKQVYVGKMEPATIAGLYAREHPTLSHCVPTVLQMVLKCPEAAQLNLAGWKMVIGGASFPEALARAAMERGMDVISGYGMSETCPVVAISYIRQQDKDRDRDWQVKARTRTGIPVAFVDMRIVDEEGETVRTDDKESGELLIRTPWLTQGYVKDPEKGAELWKGGWLHTGDVATTDAQQAIKIADRIKDVIKSGGEWISSIDLENLIGLHEGIAETAVVGMSDAKWGERPYALVVARPGYTLTIDQVREHIRTFIQKGQISKWAMPEQIEFVDAIPKTSVGKIDKKKIRTNIRLL